jgi:hypothetical protein
MRSTVEEAGLVVPQSTMLVGAAAGPLLLATTSETLPNSSTRCPSEPCTEMLTSSSLCSSSVTSIGILATPRAAQEQEQGEAPRWWSLSQRELRHRRRYEQRHQGGVASLALRPDVPSTRVGTGAASVSSRQDGLARKRAMLVEAPPRPITIMCHTTPCDSSTSSESGDTETINTSLPGRPPLAAAAAAAADASTMLLRHQEATPGAFYHPGRAFGDRPAWATRSSAPPRTHPPPSPPVHTPVPPTNTSRRRGPFSSADVPEPSRPTLKCCNEDTPQVPLSPAPPPALLPLVEQDLPWWAAFLDDNPVLLLCSAA